MFDERRDAAAFTKYLPSTGFLMTFPNATITNHAEFKTWYDTVDDFDSVHHNIRSIGIVPISNLEADVRVEVDWAASDLALGYPAFLARQHWRIRLGADGVWQILRYAVESRKPSVWDNVVPVSASLQAGSGEGVLLEGRTTTWGNGVNGGVLLDGRVTLKPAQVSVSEENVAAVLVSQCVRTYANNPGYREHSAHSEGVVLKFDALTKTYSGTFTGFRLRQSSRYESEGCKLEIAASVDGRWLVDPITGKHNFETAVNGLLN